MSFNDLNTVLYKCEEEEKDFSGFGSYNIPSFGCVVYAGLQGILINCPSFVQSFNVLNIIFIFKGITSSMADVRLRNDTGHPICNNLRAGDWLMGMH